jgi:HAE1 family hydrophobic/amphiphilic exporter-1
MKIVKGSLNRPVTVIMFTVAAVIFGFIAYSKLQLELLPEISYPTLTVKTEQTGTAPSEIEYLISKPIEEAVGVVDNVIKVSSVSKAEVSEVLIEFAWGTDMDFAALKVREKLDMLRLPIDADDPIILRYDPNSQPVMKLAFYGETGLSKIRYIAETEIKQAFESLEGVAALSISGGLEDEIHVDIDEQKVSLLNIPIATVSNRLAAENVNLSAGILKEARSQYLVRAINEFKTVEEIKDIIIDKRSNAVIRLGDIAEVFRGYKDRKVISRVNGKESIEAAVYRASDANTVKIANLIFERLKKLEKGVFKTYNINYHIVSNQAKFIKNSINEVISTAVIGGILAILVLFYFLKNLRSTLIIGIAIPVSVIITFFCMFSFGVTLNIISLGGLALGVGMLVDNSIVVLESIQRHRDRGTGNFEAAFKGTSEVGGAVIASTLTTVSVFFPIVFVKGVAGQLFRDMALTVTFSLMASLIISLTVVPMLSALKITGNSKKNVPNKFLARIISPIDRIYNQLFASYLKLQKKSFNHKKLVMLMVMGLFALSLLLTTFLGKELIPTISQGEFLVEMEFLPGTSLEMNSRVIGGLMEKIKEIDEIKSIYEIIGMGSSGGVSFQKEQENLSVMIITLKPDILGEKENRIMEQVRGILSDYSMVKSKVLRPRLFSYNAPLEIIAFGNNLDTLKKVTDDLNTQFRQVPGLTDLKSSMEEGYPELQIIFNRYTLASQGLTIREVGQQIRNKIEGDVASEFLEKDREVDIRVRLSEKYRTNVDKIKRLTIRNGLNKTVPLKVLAEITVKKGPAEIRRISQQKAAVITGNLSGITLDEAVIACRKIISQTNIPEGILIEFAGQSLEKDTAFSSMMFAIALSIFLVYLVMASQFESFKKPFIIMFTIPLGIIGVILANLIFGITINVIVLIGLIILSGIIVNNAIVLVDLAGKLQKEKNLSSAKAVKEAARIRWRPILMTSLTSILGLLPMALNFREGFEIRLPLAITLIGGLLFGTFLTLVFIPLLYSIMGKEKVQEEV